VNAAADRGGAINDGRSPDSLVSTTPSRAAWHSPCGDVRSTNLGRTIRTATIEAGRRSSTSRTSWPTRVNASSGSTSISTRGSTLTEAGHSICSSCTLL